MSRLLHVTAASRPLAIIAKPRYSTLSAREATRRNSVPCPRAKPSQLKDIRIGMTVPGTARNAINQKNDERRSPLPPVTSFSKNLAKNVRARGVIGFWLIRGQPRAGGWQSDRDPR